MNAGAVGRFMVVERQKRARLMIADDHMITQDTVNFLLRSGHIYDAEKRISTRQREVLQLLPEGKSMKAIANILNLKLGTVAFQKYSIMQRLRLKTNAELLQYAIRIHIVPS